MQPKGELCPGLKDHLAKGMIIGNEECKLVLPDSNYLSRFYKGNTFIKCVNNYHKANPGRKIEQVTFFATVDNKSLPTFQNVETDIPQTPATKRIEELKHEVYVLPKKQVFNVVEIPKALCKDAPPTNDKPAPSKGQEKEVSPLHK
jgi:hypothetical protein